MTAFSIIGCGFVADLYMRSLALYPDASIGAVYDRDLTRSREFCAHWNLKPSANLDDFFRATPKDAIVLNLTNPASHFEISKICLENGFHVYSEKPLALVMDQAQALCDLAQKRGLQIGAAPCSFLGEAAQTLGHAIRNGVAGTPRLIYAELDDGFISQAPFATWHSDSGAPWPWRDEFMTGCTVEHAGYYLSWLISYFGTVTSVVAASAEIMPAKLTDAVAAPDFSVATLFFEQGPVVRLTCSIIAPHNHKIQVMGDHGVLRVNKAWDNQAAVKFHKRFQIRRKLLEHPIGRRIKLNRKTHPKVSKKGAAAMNFALGPIELADAIKSGRNPRMNAVLALHINEVTLAIQNSGSNTGAQNMKTKCPPSEAMPWAM